MATKFKNRAERNIENPLTGDTGIAVFVMLVLIGASVAFVVCSQVIEWSDYIKAIILQLYTLAMLLGWFSFTASRDSEDFFSCFVFVCIGCGVLIAMILTPYAAFFWIALLLTVAFGIVAVIENIKSEDI